MISWHWIVSFSWSLLLLLLLLLGRNVRLRTGSRFVDAVKSEPLLVVAVLVLVAVLVFGFGLSNAVVVVSSHWLMLL
jgi:hypothetical protein